MIILIIGLAIASLTSISYAVYLVVKIVRRDY